MKRVKNILQCQKHIIRALSDSCCTFNELEHKACDRMKSIIFDEYIHALKDLAFNGRIIKTSFGFKLAV